MIRHPFYLQESSMLTEASTSTFSQSMSHPWRSCPLSRANVDDTTPLAQVTPVRLDMESEFTPLFYTKTAADISIIRKNTYGNFAFKDASEEETEQRIDAFEQHEAKEGHEFTRQGSEGEY